MEIKVKPRQRLKDVLPPAIVQITDAQTSELDRIYGTLSVEQIKAARLESAGITDRSIMASQIGVTPMTISVWRTNEDYQKLIKINVTIIENVSRTFRVDCARQILAPLYAELMTRVADSDVRKRMDTKEVVEVIKTISSEIRKDTVVASDDEKDNDLEDLQRRRQFIVASQAKAIEKLKLDGKIIELPSYKVANG